MGIFLYMKIPFVVLVSRIDIAPDAIYKKTINGLKRVMKNFNKKLVFINSNEEFELEGDELKKKEFAATETAVKCAQMMYDNPNIIPVVTISNKTGYYVDVSREMLKTFRPRKVWNDEKFDGTIFYIDSKFKVDGVGLVVSGLCKGNTIKTNDNMLIGPYGKQFVPVRVWSMHDNNRTPITEVSDKHRGCLAIRVTDKKIDFSKTNIRKGMLVISKGIEDNICYQFNSKIQVLNHSTTISNKYSPVIHCGTIRQTARIILDENQHLKMGDEAIVTFRFIGQPEYIEPGMMFFFREGTTRGVGQVVSILSLKDDPDPNPAIPKPRKRNNRRRMRPRNNRNNENKSKPKVEVKSG